MSAQTSTVSLASVIAAESQYLSAAASFESAKADVARTFAAWLGLPDLAGYNTKRDEFLAARKAARPNVSEDAHKKAWERLVQFIADEFSYEKPKATTADATRKAAERQEAETKAREVLKRLGGAPSLEQVREAAIAKETATQKEAREEAKLILAAAKLAAKEAEARAKALREEAAELVKAADERHLLAVLAALKIAIPADHEAKVTVVKAKAKPAAK